MWTVIVDLIVALLPYIKEWLTSLLNSTARDMPTLPNTQNWLAAQDLLLATRKQLWFYQIFKKAALDTLIKHVPLAIMKGQKQLNMEVAQEVALAIKRA